jgi:hypothetical protein
MGINQLIGHGWPYTAEGVEYPGWRFYAAAVFDEKNPWWIVMPDVAAYLQRVSFLLRQGTAVNDVALYLPNNDGWASFKKGDPHLIEVLRERVGTDVIGAILDSGYNFDFFDDEILLKHGRVEQDNLVLGAARYRVVVLPNVERIPLETMRKLEQFARNGGIVIATRRLPSIVPGMKATDAEQAELREFTNRLFKADSARGHFVENEKDQLGRKLTALLQPDMSLNVQVPEIGFVHRRTRDADVYFVANTANVPQTFQAIFRVSNMQAEAWDAFSGKTSELKSQTTSRSGTTVMLDLPPYGSRVLVFSERRLPASTANTTAPAAIDLSTGWRVAFGGTNSVMMDQLHSWTDDETTRYFSGTATYERNVTVPESFLRSRLNVQLDFGEGKPLAEQNLRAGMQAWLDAPVREAAVVYVNDQKAGSVWCPPYAVDVTPFLRAGNNQIKIVVANSALNYMAGRRLPDYRLLNLRYGERFQAQDMDKVAPIPAGLLGSIRLVAAPH